MLSSPQARLARTLVSALTFLGFAAIVAWIAEQLAKEFRRITESTMQTAAGYVEDTTSSLMKLVGVIEPVEQVPQQTPAEYESGDLAQDYDEPEELDWTEQAEQDISPEIMPETPIIPLDERRVVTGMPLPDLASDY